MYPDIELSNRFVSFFVFLCAIGNSYSSDDFNFLYSKLTSFQAHACDGEQLNLTCTPNTVISVQFVQYGRYSTSNELCPGQKPYYSSCSVQDALKVIQAQCHTGKVCRLLIYPGMFPNDPCRGVQKYAEVMYKCRPEEFLNKVACEDRYLYLKCPPGQVIIILSAYFGTTKDDLIDCPQIDGTETEDCTVSYADQTVDRICSGKENCSLLADTFTFGDPMCKGRKHVKVKYSCVEKIVLVRQPSSSSSDSEIIETTSFPGWFRGKDQSMKQGNHWPPGNYMGRTTESSDLLKSEMQSDEVPIDYKTGSTAEKRKIVGFVSGWVSAQKYVQGNKDKFILYTAVSLSVGFLVFMTVLAGRVFMNRMAPKPSESVFHITPETEDQFFSDSDLEQFEPIEPLPPPLNNYTASMKRKDSNVLPRAPINTGKDLNHYFS